MKNVLLPAFILGAVSSAAVAEPLPLADAQMDAITAGQVGQVDQTDAFAQQATALSAQTVGQIKSTLATNPPQVVFTDPDIFRSFVQGPGGLIGDLAQFLDAATPEPPGATATTSPQAAVRNTSSLGPSVSVGEFLQNIQSTASSLLGGIGFGSGSTLPASSSGD